MVAAWCWYSCGMVLARLWHGCGCFRGHACGILFIVGLVFALRGRFRDLPNMKLVTLFFLASRMIPRKLPSWPCLMIMSRSFSNGDFITSCSIIKPEEKKETESLYILFIALE